jgi:hypothetical protein
MKKLPLFFCLLIVACTAQKQIANDVTQFSKYPAPYHVYSVGKWNADYMIYTLTDANNKYFTVKANYNPSLKKGDVYTP